ncbi:MAG: hypothetical protein WCW66_03120 [Patescibacteria group bacterium]
MPDHFKPEQQLANPEREREYTSRVLLHFFRHGEKESIPGRTNEEQMLTAAGRRQGLETGLMRPEAKPSAMAFGSDIPRSQEMAGFDLAGAQRREDISGDESLDELRDILDQDIKIGTKLAVDPRLGFHYDDPGLLAEATKAYKNGQALKFVVENSDEIAKNAGDNDSTTYAKSAANVSEILNKYMTIASRFDQIVSDEDKKEKYSDTLERFMGSHAGVIDVFLCKVVEKLKGVEVRNKLVQALNNNGFNFAEGFDIEIDVINGETQMRIKYSKPEDERGEAFEIDEMIPREMLEEMMEAGGK